MERVIEKERLREIKKDNIREIDRERESEKE